MKIPFSLEEYEQHPDRKIETRDGRNVEIIYTDRLSERCIIALVDGVDALYYFANGRGNGAQDDDCDDDLFFVVEDSQLTDFENLVEKKLYEYGDRCSSKGVVLSTGLNLQNDYIRSVAKELMDGVKKELRESAFEKRLAQLIKSRDGDSSYPDEKLTPEELAHLWVNELLKTVGNEKVFKDGHRERSVIGYLNNKVDDDIDDEKIRTALITYFSDEYMPYNELCDIVPKLTTDKVLKYLKKI